MVLPCNADNLLLDIGKGVESNIRDLVIPAVLLEPQTPSGEKDICLTGSGKIRNTIADENDKGT